jgi:hypothetical protein
MSRVPSDSDRDSEDAASRKTDEEIARRLRLGFQAIWRFKWYVASIAVLVTGLTMTVRWIHGYGWLAWMAIALSVLPVVVTLVAEVLPKLRTQLREQRLRGWAIEQRRRDPAAADEGGSHPYFRLGPYEDTREDREAFHRADGLHTDVLHWLVRGPQMLLYLTGHSGSGKSSLLNASVLPMLRESYGFRTIVVRNFDDSLAQLHAELMALWDRPGDNLRELPLIELLDRASKRHQAQAGRPDSRLLVVVDQFEELILLHELDPQRVAIVGGFLRQIARTPVEGVTILLVVRSDYDHMLARLELPGLVQDDNWKVVGAFTWMEGERFLTNTRSGLRLGSERLRSVLDEAAIVDNTRGLIRPIILNMLGKVLERLAGRDLPEYEPGTLLSSDLRACLNAEEVRDHAPSLLTHMLTAAGTKRPRDVSSLAEATGFEPGAIDGTLRRLEVEGFVRRLDQGDSWQRDRWEISHDFVARLLVPILQSPRRSLMARIRPVLIPAALLVSVVGAFMLYELWRSGVRWELTTRYGIVVQARPGGGYRVARETDEPPLKNFAGIVPLLSHVGDVRDLEFNNCSRLEDLEALGALRSLETLTLQKCDSLKTLNSFPGTLQHLRSLTIHGAPIETLDGVPAKLPELRALDLRECSRLETLQHLPAKLPKLERLSLNRCYTLRSLDGLPAGMTELQTLDLTHCGLRTLESLPADLTNLKKLFLNNLDCLQALSGLPGSLSNLEELDLTGCDRLPTFAGLPASLPKLRALDVGFCDDVETLEHLPTAVPSLERLGIGLYSSAMIQTLPLASYQHVHELDVTGAGELELDWLTAERFTKLKLVYVYGRHYRVRETISGRFKGVAFLNTSPVLRRGHSDKPRGCEAGESQTGG